MPREQRRVKSYHAINLVAIEACSLVTTRTLVTVLDPLVHSPVPEHRRHTHERVAKVRAEQIAPSLPSPKQTLAEPTNVWQTILVGGGVPDFPGRCTPARR